jgi:putative lipase involved disintegration of autophagic bodies
VLAVEDENVATVALLSRHGTRARGPKEQDLYLDALQNSLIANEFLVHQIMSQLRLRLLLLLSIIITVNSWQFPFSHSTPLRPATTLPKSHSLKLRRGIHLHASDRSLPPLHRTYSQDDLNALEINSGDPSAKVLKTTREIAWKPSSNQAYQAARRSSYYAPRALSAGRGLSIAEVRDAMEGSFLTWEAKEIETPEITDVETLASLGKMASNAYTQSDDTAAWWDVGDKWNMVRPRCSSADRVG